VDAHDLLRRYREKAEWVVLAEVVLGRERQVGDLVE